MSEHKKKGRGKHKKLRKRAERHREAKFRELLIRNRKYPKYWYARRNDPGPDQGNIADSLRGLADDLDSEPAIKVLDLVIKTEVNEFGDWPALYVYYSLPEGWFDES